MKKTPLLLAAALLCLAACNTNEPKTDASGTEKKDSATVAATEPPPDSATMMKNWQAYATPGDVHKMMASWNGTWNAAISMWMTPDAPASMSTATAVNKMALGGRYQVSSYKGSFNGMPFEGMGTLAYDNAKKVFISSWLDNMGTGMMVMEGPWDEATKSMEMKGKMVDPSTGKEVMVREIFTVKDANTQMFQMYSAGPDGKEFKTMEIIYTRK